MDQQTFTGLQQEQVVDFDASKYPFRDLIAKMLKFEGPLEQVHSLHPELLQAGPVKFEADQSTPFHKSFYSSPHFEEFVALYQKFVKEVVAPVFKGEKSVVFQTKPTFRIQLPNNIAVAQRHKDADYNHPLNEINFWLPVTDVLPNNGFFLESQPGKGDFRHIPSLHFGQYFRFNGHQCSHYNEPNSTNQTRVSFDFRLIPGSMFQPNNHGSVKSGMTFTIGSYFTLYEFQ